MFRAIKSLLTIDPFRTYIGSRSIGILFLIFVCFSCKSDDDKSPETNIFGQWLLIEVLADPGDGSGEFTPVESDKTISISPDGSYSSNGDVCAFSSLANNPTSGSYEEDDAGYFVNCDTPFPSPVRLNIDENVLIVSFLCIEPCLHKYRRIN